MVDVPTDAGEAGMTNTDQGRFDTNDALQLAKKLRINVYKDDGLPDCDLLFKLVQFQQAARCAPAVPVPQGWKLAPVEPTEEMIKAADDGDDAYTLRAFGHGIRRVMQGPHDHYVAMLAAAPQPPEAMSENPTLAAPVQMPEPFAYVEHHKAGDNLWFDHPGGKNSALYTEQQVLAILSKHGIKTK